MSPYVWKASDGAYHILVRTVPPKSYERLTASRATPLAMAEEQPTDLDISRPDVGQEESGRWITGRIWHGRGTDDLTFVMDQESMIQPGPGELDINGCDDPTDVGSEERREGKESVSKC